MISTVRNANLDLKLRLDAANDLLDRAYGKVAQPHKISGNVGTYDLSRLSDQQLDTMYETLRLAAPDVIVDPD